MAGFFQAQAPTATGLRIPLLPECGICKLDKGCHSPKMKVFGQGRKGIMVIGEAPGKTEDEQGRPFIGDSGQLLAKTMDRFGVDLYEDCWIINSVRCRPALNKLPEKAIGHCRPNVKNDIEKLKPRVLILLGGSAVKSVLAWLWGEDVGTISRWDGWTIPCQRINCWLCPTWHPSYILRTGYGVSGKENDVRQLLFERHIKAACELQGRPWDPVPDWDKRLVVTLDTDKAAELVTDLMRSGKPLAFDYETDRLKPDHKDAHIVSCAVSNGRTSVAFPWMGDVIETVGHLLFDGNIPKIGYNISFEEKWSVKEFGYGVENWVWDGMLAAHTLDNRPDICAADFQAFVLLGVDNWKGPMEPYMKAKTRAGGNNAPNRVPEAPLPDLLRYNAKDALFEWFIAREQSRKMGVEL